MKLFNFIMILEELELNMTQNEDIKSGFDSNQVVKTAADNTRCDTTCIAIIEWKRG